MSDNFELTQPVVLVQTGERGIIAGRQERLDAPMAYLVRYAPAGGGVEHDRWLEGHQIEADPDA